MARAHHTKRFVARRHQALTLRKLRGEKGKNIGGLCKELSILTVLITNGKRGQLFLTQRTEES